MPFYQENKQIKEQLVSWKKAFNERDAAAIEALYWDSFIMVIPGLPVIKDKPALKEALENIFLSKPPTLEMHDQIYESVADDVTVSIGSWTYIWSETNKHRDFTDVVVWKKSSDGQWMIMHDIFNYRNN